jgi:predicted phage terminase large subunit-like protein
LKIEIKPQEGPQTEFLKTKADVAIYGGAAGSGKTFVSLLEPLRHLYNEYFNCTFFRRETTQITNPGGLWDEALNLYVPLGARPRSGMLMDFTFPSKMRISFRHIQHEKTILNYQGAQIPLMIFDELTHFSYRQFFYMLSRNRSMSGVRGYMRATCNPDPDSWVRELIDWWIKPDGFPDQSKSGVLRYFIRKNEQMVFADSKEELIFEHGPDIKNDIKSLTFIPANIQDNKILLEKDPSYLASLKALPKVDRQRLLEGNWNVRPSQGDYFKERYFQVIEPDQLPSDRQTIRFWDRAATEKTEGNNPDFTAGLKLSHDKNGLFYVEHLEHFQEGPAKVEQSICNTASRDGRHCIVGLSQDPGQAGKFEMEYYVKLLVGYQIYKFIEGSMGDKETRAKPVSSQAEHGNIKVVRGPWNRVFFDELESFGDRKSKKDIVDSLSGAFSYFTTGPKVGTMNKSFNEIRRNTFAPSRKSGPTW